MSTNSCIPFHAMICKRFVEIEQELKLQNEIISPQDILKAVGVFFGIPEEQIKSNRRFHPLVLSRGYFVMLCRELCFVVEDGKRKQLSLKRIGKIISGRDHSTIIHTIKTYKQWMKDKTVFRKYYPMLRKQLINKQVFHNASAAKNINSITDKGSTEYNRIYRALKKEHNKFEDTVIVPIPHVSDPHFSYRSKHA